MVNPMKSGCGGEDRRTAGVSEAWKGFQRVKNLVINDGCGEEYEPGWKVPQLEGHIVASCEGTDRTTYGSLFEGNRMESEMRPRMDAGCQKSDEENCDTYERQNIPPLRELENWTHPVQAPDFRSRRPQ